MIKSFRIPVTPEQDISVVYQKPDSASASSELAASAASAKSEIRLKITNAKPINRTDNEQTVTAAPKPLIIMLHDFPGAHKGGTDDLFGELEFRFEQWGYPSLRFDYRGCGESDGTPGDFSLDGALEDLNAVIEWAETEAGHRQVVLLGESLGGTIAVMGHDPKYVQGLMLLWPAIIPKETHFRELFTHEARMANDKRNAPFVTFQKFRLGVHFYNELYKTDLTAPMEKITAPVLIQHGSADTDIPLSQSYVARDHLKGPVEIAVFEGGDHGLHAANMREAMYMNISYFLTKLLKKLDSAARN